MPLDDREQKILDEIERQFYEEDPALAHAVRNIHRKGRFGVRLPLLGVLAGAIIIIVTFTSQVFVALIGFIVMVLSATALVHSVRARGGLSSSPAEGVGRRLRTRFRRS